MFEENDIIEIDEEEFEIENEQETEENKFSAYYIYKYTNLNNNKIYVGLCKNPDRRQSSHKSAAEKGKNSCPLFYRSIRKHGYDSFTFEIIEKVNGPIKANEREMFWIAELNARNNEVGYNISPGGGGRGNPNNTDTHKQCANCKEIKLRDYFCNILSSPDGKNYYCKVCEGLKQQERHANFTQEQLDALNEKRREIYHNNPDVRQRIIKEVKRYYTENTEKVYERQKRWNEENKEHVQERNHENYIKNQEDRKEAAKQDRIRLKESNSKLTIEQILANTPIKHCNGCDKDKNSNEFYIDLTRINGLGRLCKECAKEQTRKNHLKKLNRL